MKRFILAIAAVFALTSLPAGPAAAEDPPKVPPAEGKIDQIIDIDEGRLTATKEGPTVETVGASALPAAETLVKPREEFMDQMIESANNL